jgi:glycosyltransferase involved in cell wall biosynthesis
MAALRVAYLLDRFPVRTETFVTNEIAALRERGVDVVVEAAARGDAEAHAAGAPLAVHHATADGRARRLADLGWLVATRPAACVRDLRARRRWAREEWPRPLRHLAPVARRLDRAGAEHLHAHFAAGAALDALRLARLLGRSYGVTAHAYDIFMTPRNLAEKLERADVAVTVCAYNARHLRAVAPRAALHTMVMGVDGRRFARATPRPHGRTVVAVGRLVEKKGFADLVEAAARLAGDRPLDRVLVVGDGPLRGELEATVARLGLGEAVELPGAVGQDGLVERYRAADVFCLSSFAEGVPVVLMEAMACELPVVAPRINGIPELVEDGVSGLLVPPARPDALADALAVLAGEPERRAAMGRAGRARVAADYELRRSGTRLTEFLSSV